MVLMVKPWWRWTSVIVWPLALNILPSVMFRAGCSFYHVGSGSDGVVWHPAF